MGKAKTKSKRKPAASKAKTGIENSTLSYPEAWLRDAFSGGVEASSGERVNEKIAMGLSAYLACIKNISEDVGKLPLGIFKHLEPRGSSRERKHPADRLVSYAPNVEMTAMTWRETITAHALGYHGGFSEIVFDGGGRPTEIWPIDPTTVQVMRLQAAPYTMFYMVDGVPMPSEMILHVHGLGYDGITGYCIARLAKETIGAALASQKFSGSFFANGTTLSGTLEVPDALSETAFKHLRESFHARHGSADRQHKPLILEQGTKYSPISADPQKSQMVETLQWGVEDVCRLFRMPPHKIGHLLRSTNNNIEHQALEYVQDTLLAWLVRWEQEIRRKLLLQRERDVLFAKHNLDMLLRGDTQSRSAFYKDGFFNGWLNPNDIREKEDLNPIEGGDTYFVQSAMVPLKMAATGEHLASKQPETTSEPADDGEDEPTPPRPTARNQSDTEHQRKAINRIAAVHCKTIERELTSILRIERDKVLRASRKPDFASWTAAFYGAQNKKEVSGRIKPLVESLATSIEAVLWN